VSAAKEIRKKDPLSEIIIITEEMDPFYYKPYLLTLLLHRNPAKMQSDSEKLLAQFRIELISLRKVVAIDLARGYPIIRFENDEPISFDYLVIATGRRAEFGQLRKWQQNCYRLDTQADVQILANHLPHLKSLIVYGADELALRTVHTLRQLRKEVTVIHDGSISPFQMSDPLQENFFLRAITRQGATVKKIREIQSLTGTNGDQIELVTDSNEPIRANGIITAQPFAPDVHFARFAEVVMGAGIKVTADLQTTQPNIFSAGDCAEIIDLKSGEPMFNNGWRSAVRQGEMAGRNIATYAENPDAQLEMVTAIPPFFRDRVQLVAV